MTYRAPSTGLAVRAVLFDTFGTVVDWRSGIAAAAGSFAARHGLKLDAPAFADSWRGQYQPSMAKIRSGARPYVSLDVLHRENLDVVLRGLGLDPDGFGPAELDELSRAWHFLPPWPDSVPGTAAIRRGYVTGPLSNGSTALLLDLAKTAGLPWDVILGSDVSGAYKPDPRAYQRPAELLGLRPGEVMLAAAHEADLAGARGAGLATAFIARPAEFGPAGGADTGTGDWDLAAAAVTELAALLSP